jgi:hypothetical protein
MIEWIKTLFSATDKAENKDNIKPEVLGAKYNRKKSMSKNF